MLVDLEDAQGTKLEVEYDTIIEILKLKSIHVQFLLSDICSSKDSLNYMISLTKEILNNSDSNPSSIELYKKNVPELIKLLKLSKERESELDQLAISEIVRIFKEVYCIEKFVSESEM